MDTARVSVADIAWLAGLFEGEGSMEIGKNGMVRLCIRMTDRDVIDRVSAMFSVNQVDVIVPKPVRDSYNQPKTQYAWRPCGHEKVKEILELLLPWLGVRRTAKALEVLAHIDARPGRPGWFNRNKTHCSNGHEFTPENTYPQRQGGEVIGRGCRICRTQWATDYRDRKRALTTVP